MTNLYCLKAKGIIREQYSQDWEKTIDVYTELWYQIELCWLLGLHETGIIILADRCQGGEISI